MIESKPIDDCKSGGKECTKDCSRYEPEEEVEIEEATGASILQSIKEIAVNEVIERLV